MHKKPPLSDYYGNTVIRPNVVKNYRNQFAELIILNKAYGLMLVKQRLMDKADYDRIAAGLDQVRSSLHESDMDGKKHDLFFNVEQALNQQIGEETACKLHTGRSRNDIYYTITRMEIRKSLWAVMEQVLLLQSALLESAREHTESVLPYYSYGQPAQPGTLAHYYLAVTEGLNRDFTRLKSAYANTNVSVVGSCACIGTSFPVDREMMRDLLGFDSIMENTLDAVAAVDFILEAEAAIAIMMASISKVAADLFFWATDECRIMDFGYEIATGSSIMPQKKNAAGIESIRAKSSHAAGLLVGGLTGSRSTSLFPVRDNFEMTFLYWENVEESIKALGMFRDDLRYMKIRRQTAYERANKGFTGASAMAEYLAQTYGIPFVQTHHVVGGMVKTLMEKDALNVENMTSDLLKDVSKEVLGREIVMSDAEIARLLDPAWGLEAKVTGGTPKKSDALAMLERLQGTHRMNGDWLGSAKKTVEDAYARVEKGAV